MFTISPVGEIVNMNLVKLAIKDIKVTVFTGQAPGQLRENFP